MVESRYFTRGLGARPLLRSVGSTRWSNLDWVFEGELRCDLSEVVRAICFCGWVVYIIGCFDTFKEAISNGAAAVTGMLRRGRMVMEGKYGFLTHRFNVLNMLRKFKHFDSHS